MAGKHSVERSIISAYWQIVAMTLTIFGMVASWFILGMWLYRVL